MICYFQINARKKYINQDKKINDTIIVKHQNSLDKTYEISFYSKSYSYFWIVGKDTLDFALSAQEYENDKSMSLNIFHRNPMKFETALKNIDKCFPLIQEDFNTEKLNSLYFTNSFIFYPDIVNGLSNEYEKKYGRKRTSYSNLNNFLLNSKFNEMINDFLESKNKKVFRYSIEKFNLIEKEYFKYSLPNSDLKNYPEFSINGMGTGVRLQNKQ